MKDKTLKDKNKFADRMEKLVSPLSKIGSNKHLTAMRDGFALTLPFTIAGAMAILFVTVVFGGWGAQKTSIIGLLAHASGGTIIKYNHIFNSDNTWALQGNWHDIAKWLQKIFSVVNTATLGSISIYVALSLGYAMASIRRAQSSLIGGAISVGVFIIITGGNRDYLGSTGIVMAIISGLAGTEVYLMLMKSKKLRITMPSSVPPAVGRAFTALLPGFLTFLAFEMGNVAVSIIFALTEGQFMSGGAPNMYSIAEVVNIVILQPFLLFAKQGGDIAIIYVYVFATVILWFFGLHGSNTIDGAFAPIGLLLWIDNMNGGHNVGMGQVWNGFGFFGGAGATLPLVILTLVFMKNVSPQREVAKFALPAGIFNINEPVIFGFPIIFNMLYFIPFVFSVPISLICPIIAIKTELMNAPTLIAPWTTPPILYGLIVTQFDWRSIPVSLIVFIIQILVWTPFVLTQKNIDTKNAMKTKSSEKKLAKVKGVA